MSKRGPRSPLVSTSGYPTSIVRCAVAGLLVVLGIAWIVVYYTVARHTVVYVPGIGTKPSDPLPWMAHLKRWNYLIGWGLVLIGLGTAAHPATPLGRGRGVVVGMLFCFLFGLFYILVYYFAGNNVVNIPVMDDLEQWNLLVGIGFMAVGFSYATRWE